MVGPTCVANQITLTSSTDVATSKQTTNNLDYVTDEISI